MKRKIYDKMLKWKRVSNGKTAVMLDGARRVGKSYIAEEFGSWKKKLPNPRNDPAIQDSLLCGSSPKCFWAFWLF